MKVDFQMLGDEALLINFEQKIDIAINSQVHALALSIEAKKIEGIVYITPAYCSLVVAFDKKRIGFEELKNQINLLVVIAAQSGFTPRKLYIPVCYHREFALDMEEVMTQTQLLAADIVKKHTSQTFKTYMIGFLPGFPYLGKLPKELECVRKANPCLKIPKGAVGLAGLQTGIYPQVSPGGWQIIGNTPIDLINPDKTHSYLFEAGDEVHFYSISKSKYKSIIEDQKNENFNWENVYEQAN